MVTTKVSTGCVTFWTLSEHSNIEKLKESWDNLGFGKFVPEPRAPLACLKDALVDVVGNSRVLIRPLASKQGFVVVDEERGADENAYSPKFSARIVLGNPDPVFNTWNEDVSRVLDAYRAHVGRLTSAQVAGAMVKILNNLGATRLRPTGGVYWLTGDKLRTWEEITKGVSDAAIGISTTYVIEHELNADSIIAVRDAIVHEVTYESKKIAKELIDGDLGDRAVETRYREADSLRKKVEQYEEILGVCLSSLKESIDEIGNTRAMATLLLSSSPFEQEEASHAASVA